MPEQHNLGDIPPIGLEAFERILSIRDRARSTEQRDAHHAARGERLAAFVAGQPIGGVWDKDLLPMLTRLYDQAEELIRPGAPDQAALQGYKQALRDFVNLVSGNIQLGQGAIKRLAARKLERIRYDGG